MIKMKITRFDRNNDNTPILSNDEIDKYAHDVLEDYKPELLREPGTVPFEHFLESYLGLELRFKDIYNEDPKNPIWGRTVFHETLVKIFDRENECIKNMPVRANTIVLDNYLLKKGLEGMLSFTGFHEGAHFLLHSEVTSLKQAGQMCCRRKNVENLKGLPQTAEQWREHHANRFASSFSMPDSTFLRFVNEFLRDHGIYKRCIILGQDDDLDIFAKDLLPERISEVYGVSQIAASIKLKKCGFVAVGAKL